MVLVKNENNYLPLKEDEDIFFEIIDLKYNQHNELYTKVKWSDNNISVITADKIYWEYTKI